MSRSVFKHLRLIGPLTVAATLSMGTLPAFAQAAPSTVACSTIHFELANPSVDTIVAPGAFVVQGIAMDSRAKSGLGIDKIDFFLDSREGGGVFLGTVAPGAVPGPYGPTSFQASLSVPNKVGAHDFFAYAHSSVNAVESVIDVPVSIGEDPSKAHQTASAATTSCKLGNPPSSSTSTTSAAPTTTTTTVPSAAPTSASTILLSVSNPSPNNTIKAGGYVISGTATDTAALGGSGIDRIDIFLDYRDSGGMFLGTATMGAGNSWQATVSLPTNQTGLHNLSFYAHSLATGQTLSTTIPVTIIH